MNKTLFRRVAVGTFAAAAAVGLSTLFATAASAHNAGPSGVAKCGDDGKYTVTWTVHNDYPKPVTLSNIHITPDGGTHANISLPASGTETFTTTYSGDTKKDLVLSVDGLWQDSATRTWPTDGHPATFVSSKVHLAGDCKAKTPPTTQPPTTTPAAPKTPEASKSATPSLPVTGSSSTLPLVGTGAALVVAGAALVVTLRRRRRVTFTAE